MKQFLLKGYTVYVDDENFDLFSRASWSVSKRHGSIHAVKHVRGKRVAMQDLVLPPKEGFIVDHKDGNGLNNTKTNLRYATYSQNGFNRKNHKNRFRGVSWNKQSKKWVAQICYLGTRYYLGAFTSDVEAAKVWDKEAINLFGEFATLNFPLESRALTSKA